MAQNSENSNAAKIVAEVTKQAVLLVAEANEGKRMTRAQWTAAVQRTFEALLTTALDDMAQEDPEAAEGFQQRFAYGLAQDGHAN